ncbi:hypothetical protein ELI15_14245 [Rhizobium ruizarguesonis]|uniref:hypothetical protein n=1 Tax=Rhizobium ruizarguesonis TaxID=2081791 RepID=UPI001031E727|nr:hypothetical protein [Rhizobium ruizarguesonis]TAW65450.1 hypothetical protein ELI15_14245 [Rhizobium ruizarguesonis]
MGSWLPKTPTRYQPDSSVAFREQLTAALLEYFHREGITAVELAKRIPAVRAAYIKEMRGGMLLGEKRLLAMCEATGIKVDVSTTLPVRQQTIQLEAA